MKRSLGLALAALLSASCSSAGEDSTGGGPARAAATDGGAGALTGDRDGGAGPAATADAGVAIPIGTQAELDAWLASGAYKAWTCEAEIHERRPGSAHARNRICVNPTLEKDAGTGPYPVGAAGVKELYDGAGAVDGYAVYVKVKPGASGDTWFWYERIGTSVVARAEGAAICVGCHSGAPRDHVFTPSPR